MYKLLGLFSLFLLFTSSIISAESFKDFKTTQAQAFSNYKDERDAAFSSYIKQQWNEYSGVASKPFFQKKKPTKINPTRPQKIKALGPRTQILVKPSEKILMPKKQIVQANSDINFDFFGTKLGFDVPKSAKTAKYYPHNQEGITSFFDVMASSEYEDLLTSIITYKKDLQLNDWALYLLVTKLSQNIFSNPDEAKLLSWFLFNKLDYDVRVGLAHKHIVLMHCSKKIIYSTPNYTFEKKKFYVISEYAKGKVGRLYSYEKSYPNTTKALDLSLKTLPKFEKDMKHKTLTFKENGKKYSLSYEYNKNILDFMATYPQADYGTFFNAPIEEDTYAQIAKGLKEYIDGKKASVAMNFVLNFVQKAFVYQVDDEQFGREKVMFAEETLYYDKSDCEDRAILFSYLMKKLFHVGVIGVKYKDHMSTALYIPLNGDNVRYKRKKYIIADPTYVNANIGMSMPKYRSIRPDSFIKVSS